MGLPGGETRKPLVMWGAKEAEGLKAIGEVANKVYSCDRVSSRLCKPLNTLAVSMLASVVVAWHRQARIGDCGY